MGFIRNIKNNIKENYQVDKTYQFVDKEKIRLESGKEIEIFKYKKTGLVEEGIEYQGQELWLSGEVPTYFVYFADFSNRICLVSKMLWEKF